MINLQTLHAKLIFMLTNQIQLKEEHGDLPPWNKGYKEAIEDILHYLEHGEDDCEVWLQAMNSCDNPIKRDNIARRAANIWLREHHHESENRTHGKS